MSQGTVTLTHSAVEGSEQVAVPVIGESRDSDFDSFISSGMTRVCFVSRENSESRG